MKNLILLEYFTSQSFFNPEKDKEILNEALNISDSIIKNFIKNNNVKKIYVIRNDKLKIIKSKKVETFHTNFRTTYLNVLEKIKNTNEILLIAPETNKISLKLYSSIPKRFKILCSDTVSLKIFSSKKKTLKILKESNIPATKITISDSNQKIVIKPNFGAGSDRVIIKKGRFTLQNKDSLTQKLYTGKKGSFLMLCKNGKSKVICCNEQLIKISSNRIQQIGCIMGGLENHRSEIELLGKKLCESFKGLYGVIGVDIVKEKERWLILEVNSRFTSSYCGLSKSYGNSIINEITDFYFNEELKISIPKIINKYNYYFNE